MKILTKSLLPVVAAATKLAARITTLPILNHLLLDGTDGCLSVSATDIDIYLSENVEATGRLDRVCVPAKPFCAMLESAGETVELTMTKAGRLKMVSGWTREFSVLDAREFVAQPDVKGMKEQAFPANDLATAIDAVSWAGFEGDPGAAQWKICILVEMAAKSLSVMAMDGYKMGFSQKSVICSDLRWLLPVKAADVFVDALRKDGVRLYHSDRKVVIHHDTGFLAVSLPEAKYPDHRAVTASEVVPAGTMKPDDLIGPCERAASLFGEKSNAVMSITTHTDRWNMECETDSGTYKDSIAVTDGLPDRTLNINPNYLLDALRKLKRDEPATFSMLKDTAITIGRMNINQGDLLFAAAGRKI